MDDDRYDELAIRAGQGDRAAFRELVLASQTALRQHLALRCTAFDLVEETVQETYLAAFRALPAYRAQGRFLPWLQRIGRNLLNKELRRRRRETVLAGDHFAEWMLDPYGDPSDQILADEQQQARSRALDHCLAHLGDRASTILLRHHVDRLPLKKLAQQFKRPEAAINRMLMKIRRTLRDCLRKAQVDV